MVGVDDDLGSSDLALLVSVHQGIVILRINSGDLAILGAHPPLVGYIRVLSDLARDLVA